VSVHRSHFTFGTTRTAGPLLAEHGPRPRNGIATNPFFTDAPQPLRPRGERR